MRRVLFVVPLALLAVLGLRSQTEKDAAEAIRLADGAWLKAVQAKDIDKVLSFYRDGAAWLLRDTPPLKGKDSIRRVWSGFFATPGSWIQWEPGPAEVSVSGDLGYTTGTYEMKSSDRQGQAFVQKGSYVTIWKKDIDGAWKLVVDISN